MKLKANAKINLMLDVTGVKENGYHKLYTVMQSVSLCDTLTVEKAEGEEIIITCTEDKIPCDKRNIVYKCAEKFYEKLGVTENRGLKIHIEKNIPSEAGLGGGSSDGAAVLKALNLIYGEPFSLRELLFVGAGVGADIPFILAGGTALCTDIGSVVAPLPDLKDCCFVIVKPDSSTSTKGAYEMIDSSCTLRHPKGEKMTEALLDGDILNAFSFCDNIFEQVIEVPERVDIKDIMRKCGANAACMSGSGSSVFGAFINKSDAEKCEKLLKNKYRKVYLCVPSEFGVKVID